MEKTCIGARDHRNMAIHTRSYYNLATNGDVTFASLVKSTLGEYVRSCSFSSIE